MKLLFQIIDIQSDDLPLGENYWDKQFIITLYGKTEENKNVVCSIQGYQPFFYIRIPDNWGNTNLRSFLKLIKNFIQSWYKESKTSWKGGYIEEVLETKQSYNFYGYNYDDFCDKIKQYRFAKISFDSYGEMKKCIQAIQTFYKENKTYIPENKIVVGKDKDKKAIVKTCDAKMKPFFEQNHNCDCVANLYESKIHPMLRFLHEKKINPCGWVELEMNPSFIQSKDQQVFNVDIEINNLPMRSIKPYKSESTASFITASFDIECDSSHGDFPNPKKDFKKPAIDIHESYFRNSLNLASNDFKRLNIVKWIKECFKNGSNDIQCIYTVNGKYSDDSIKVFESDLSDSFLEIFDNSKSNTKTREKAINDLTSILNNLVNNKGENIIIKGDPIIQIGTVFHKYGEKECYDRSIVVIGNEDKPDEKICDDIQNVNVYSCKTEKDLLLKWKDLILHHNPDLFTGYNIFGFDFDYINKRVDYLFPCSEKCGRYHDYKCPKHDFYRLGRLMRNRDSDFIEEFTETSLSKPKTSMKYYNNHWEKRCQVVKKELSSSGLGDNILNYISMDGRVIFDIQKEIQKGHALDSYKLDNVSAHFMKGKIKNKYKTKDDRTILYSTNIGNLKVNDYVTINLHTKYGSIRYKNGKKFKIRELSHKNKGIVIEGFINIKKYRNDLLFYEWCLAKDDVSPQQIFDFHKNGGSEGRAKIAKYCIMDCELCIHLLQLLDFIPNNMGMANVSTVPLSYIFLRGQGIRISSLVVKECSKHNTRIPTLKNFSGDSINDGFEGAIVLDPTPGIYLDDPVSVLDYASLYPSSIIEKNLSHETFMCTQEEIDKNPEKYKWIENIPHHIISYDDYTYQMKGKTVHKIKEDTQTTCYFAKYNEEENEKRGIVPTILQTLLDQRKSTRKRIKQTDDEDKKKVLDGLQLAYKVSANSVYGQMGAKTSSICFKKIAACTTAIGRQRIDDASNGVKMWAEDEGYDIPEIVYGDTDSVFVKFSRKHKDTGEILEGKEGLQYCIDCGIKAGKWVTEHMLHKPQDLEYEKTFFPFILISKKRYTGDKYELSADILKERTSMGIVMKRRDNAAIVKYVFGNVIEIIINQKSVDKAIEWLKKTLKQIMDGKIDKSMFIISKSLSGYYKNPEGIAHKVLADRMTERNPGNKPKPNDRIPFMYRILPKDMLFDYNNLYKSGSRKGQPRVKKVLQGDRIEHPDFMEENNIDIDYKFYISNQIMNPVKQVLDLEKSELETQEIFKDYI
jgi:DNA polymerase elongation subunit (family B)